jgi:hypothetical protein
VAGNLKKDARRSEVEEGTGARESVSTVVATSAALMRQRWGVTAMWWRGWDTRRKAGERRFTGEHISSSRRVEGKSAGGGGGVTGVESSSPAAKIPSPAMLSVSL